MPSLYYLVVENGFGGYYAGSQGPDELGSCR
jgi:hypothetical protein